MRFEPRRAREDFPGLAQQVHGRPLVYLDSAATTQMPAAVIAAVERFSRDSRANVHRGVHALSERATAAYEAARARVARFLNARSPDEIVFCRGTTEALNLVAATFGRARVGAGDEVLVTALEHHANILPWQRLCQERGATLRVLPISDDGDLLPEQLDDLLGPRTRLFAVAHVANAIGTINPVADLVRRAHARNVPVVVDGAQAAAHLPVDVQALGCDFYALSGHKVYGPTGVGALYGRAALLSDMPPFLTGGEMVRSVSFEGSTWAEPPHRFEAGTPPLEGAVGLAAALDYLTGWDRQAVAAHEQALAGQAAAALAALPGVRLFGRPAARAPIVAFTVEGIHPHDLGTVLDQRGVAIRAGHHCAEPLHRRLGSPASARASFALYNTPEEVEALVAGVRAAREMMAP